VNPLQNALRNPDGFVRSLPLLLGALKHHYSWLVPEYPSNQLDVHSPEICHFQGRVMTFSRRRSLGPQSNRDGCGSLDVRSTEIVAITPYLHMGLETRPRMPSGSP
jgi:hypothetical protein